MFKFLRTVLFIGIGIIALVIIAVVLSDSAEEKASQKVKDLIEQGDYIQAKKLAPSSSDRKNVTSAQVSDLIRQGRFDLAAEIAKEDEYYITYYDGVFNHLAQIYNDQGAENLFYALSLISFPDTKSCYADDSWGCKYNLKPCDIVKKSNANIESFCDYLKLSNKKEFIPKMLIFLRPVYVPDEEKWDVKKQKDILIKKGYMDYSEVSRIKAKYGY